MDGYAVLIGYYDQSCERTTGCHLTRNVREVLQRNGPVDSLEKQAAKEHRYIVK